MLFVVGSILRQIVSSKLDCYDAAECCNADCDYIDVEDQPCWGTVEVADEMYWEYDHWWVHACQGHIPTTCGQPYAEKKKE